MSGEEILKGGTGHHKVAPDGDQLPDTLRLPDPRLGRTARLPGFTAESSIYRCRRDYRAVRPTGGPANDLRRNGRTLSHYHPRWPSVFQIEQRRIRAVLGERAIAIEHVGSTSVPGLGGRAEIDILVGVGSVNEVEESARLLRRLGYATEARAPSPSGSWCLMSRPGPVPFEVLIVEHSSRLWRRHLWLRDYLRHYPARARAYGRLKSEWAARYGSGTEGYKEAKRRFWSTVEEPTTRMRAPGAGAAASR